jgi:two-component system cell cycle response regulator DivK
VVHSLIDDVGHLAVAICGLFKGEKMEKAHALIIDDSPTGLEVLSELLGAIGVHSTTVQHPSKVDEAIQQLERIDVVFLDLEMPQVDGYGMLQKLRDYWGISAPIIAYTVHVSELDTARRLGFDGFLGKPVDIDRFPAQFERIMRGDAVWEVAG